MKFYRKSQITIYVAVLIIIISGTFLFLFNRGLLRLETVSPEIEPIRTFVEECIMEVGQEGIYTIGKQGGYFATPEPHIDGIPFYLYESKNHIPSKEIVDKELGLYVENMLPFCTGDYENFKDFKIVEKTIQAKAVIEDEKVFFTVNMPLQISKDTNSYFLKNFETKIPVRLGLIHKTAEKIMTEQMKKTDAVCTTCLYKLSEENKFHIHVMDMNETGTLLFVIRDEQSKILEDDFHYYFINKLSPSKQNDQ